ncbi:MAG: hypothetical protein HN916_09980 [Anaerolineae bacterium]|nr:hypothetical protein [Anaerolineae bacterium]MBT7991515.1 hypothetical protein [Anaerolineae bacterium]
MKFPRTFTFIPFFFSLLACRPVLTIGWTEIFILGVILLTLTGPSLWRFYLWYRKYKGEKQE